MPEGIDKGLLEEYIATANSGKYKSMAEVNAKFPELKDYSPDLLEEYVATANSGKYKTLDEVNSKFPEFSTSKTPAVPSFSTDMSNTNTLPVMKNSPLQANVDKPVKVVAPTYIDPTKVLKTKDVVDINAEKAPKTMAQIDEESRITMQNRNIFTLTQRGLDESIEYQNLLVKKLAKELGYTDDNSLKGTTAVQKLANDRQEGWKEDYLEPEELAQVRAFEDYEVFKEQGREKESNEALQKYLNSRTEYRKKIDNDIVDLKGELVSAEGDDAVLIRATIAELEAKKLPFYDPKKQMESFLTENETDVAAVSKPTETAQEKLKKYILAQDNLVTNLRNRLGITGKNNSFQRFTDEWKVLQGDRRQKDDLELLHNTELKIKNAVQILELNRTPLDKDSAWGVLAKEFVGELIPMKKGFSGVDNTIAANIGSIVRDADITYAANEKQVQTAEFASNQYQFGSAKWVSQNLAPTLAIMVEMIPATLLTEGLGSTGYLSRLSRPLKILAERGSLGKAGGTFFKVIQANKYGRGLLKAAASGVNYGIESQAVTMLAPQLKDEMGFSNGLFAGTVGSIAGQLTGKVMETSLKSIATLFGNKAPQAIAAIEKYGSVIAKAKEFSNTVAGETVEEYGEQLMSIYKESDNYKNFIYNLKKHYETTDALEEFATILMMSVGAPAGSTLGKSLFSASKKAYNNLSRKERETASRMADEIHNEVNLAMDDAANQTIRDENIQVPTRSNEEQDNAILQKQKDLKLPTAPEVVLSDVSKAAMAKMEGGEALTIEELKELSNELYQRYNGISATKDQDNRQFTTEQINETLIKLENNITLLENSKNKLEESGEASIVVNPNEAVTQDAKPVTSTPNTKFYQGVDFRAQTGLPNGDYTEEQVKAAREAKLKKEGVTPAEIETINAEEEIIPATETPAAPISGVSGEVQASGDVEQTTASENEVKAEEIRNKLDKLTEGFVNDGKTEKEAEDLAFKSISEEEKQVLRDSYNESRNQPKTKQNDKENGTGVQSNIGEGQEPIKTQPIETTGGEKIEASGNVQASEEEVVKPIADQIEELRVKEKAEYDAMPNQKDDAKREKIYEKYNALITPLLEQQKEEIKQAEKTTSVYVAPFYDATVKDIKEVKDIEKSPAYKKYIETMYSAAEALGIKIKKTVGNLGKYTHDTTGIEISEISTLVELETDDIEKATEFAVLMGALAPEVQESTISAQVLSEDEITPDRHTADFHNIKVDNIKEAVEIAALSGLDHTIIVADNVIQIISFKYWSVEENDEFDQKVENLIQKLKEKGINYETNTKAVESRFITASPSEFTPYNREDIIRRMEEKVGKNDGDTGLEKGLLRRRQMLRDAIQNAKIRNNEFLRQEKLASERAEYGKLRTKQIELEKNGERLSDEEVKRFTELLNILIPSTQETIRNASEDYEEARKELEKVAAKVIGDLGFLSTFGIKRAERAATKILRWYKGKAQWLGDGARTNLIAYNEKDVMVLYKKLQAQFKGGIIRLEKDPTELGYPKKLLEVRTSNGKIAEFQVMTPEGYLAKDGINGFPEEKRDFAAKELAKIQKRLGWLIPDGVGHYFYEIERDFNVPTDLRERAKAISLKYYNAFLKADSKYTEKEFLDEISQFKKDVDAADKTNWDKGNNGISPVTVNDFIEDTNNQYEPITVSDTSHDTFTKDNAIDYEEDEKEGDNGRSYTYLASVTVSLVDDVSGETIGSITKLKDEYGDVTWSAEDSDGSEVADNVGTKNEAQRALVEQHNKQKAKEFNKEKARGIKERTKQRAIEAEKAAKAKEKAEKESEKEKAEKEKAEKETEKAKPEQTEKEKAKEKAKEALRAKAAAVNAEVVSAAQRVQQALEATGITVEVIDNEKDFQDKLDAEGVKRDSSVGASGVFISKSGKIFINASKVDAKWGSVDVWHEGTHPIINIIRNTNPKLYKSIIDGLNELVASNPEIAAVVEWAQSNYEGENTLEDETITETIARIANGNIDLSKIPTSLRDKIIDFINGIAKSLGLKPMLKGSNIATFKKMAKEISAALKEGKDISSIVGMDNVKNFENLRNEDGSDFDQFKISNKFRNLISGITFEYESDSQNFKDLVKKDKITNNKVLSDFEDMFVMLHVPDNAFTGFIYKDGEILVEGKGGVYFPIKFNKEGYFWASTEAGVDKLVDVLNKTRAANKDKDGKVRLALISSRAQKIMSSTNASNNMIEILFSKAFDKRARLSEAQVKRAIFNASNEIQTLFQEDYDKKIKDLENKIKSADNKIKKKIEVSKNEKEKRSAEKSLKSAKASGAVQAPVFNLKESADSYMSKLAIFNNVDNSSFEERKLFNELTLKNIRDLINEEDDRLNKGDKKKERQVAQEILTFLGQGKESIKFKTSGGRLSTANLIAGFSDLLGEPTLKGENSNNIYAILEIDTDVEKVRIDDAHGSYPFAVKGKEGSSIVLHILQDRRNWQQSVLDPETNKPIGEEEIIDEETGEPKTYEKRIAEILPPTAGITFEPIKISTKSQPQLSKGNRGKTGKPINWEQSKEGKGDPSISSRNSIVQEAAKNLKEGKITNEEYRATASENSPIRAITRFFNPATLQEIRNAFAAGTKKDTEAENINKPVKEGTRVGLRLDIPSYKFNNTWVVSIHEGFTKAGKILSYSNVAKIKNVSFEPVPEAALNIATGDKTKSSVARMYGEWQNIQGGTMKERGENAKKMVQDIVNDPNYVQVGMNPFRQSYFYDRSSDIGRPIKSADEVIQIGGLVYAKNPVYGNWTDEAYRVKGLLDANQNPVQFSKGGRDVQPVVDMIKESQNEGELTDKEIAETLEDYFPKEDIQAAFDLINNPTENESPTTTTEQAEFTPNVKDIESFKKILGTTSGAIRNKNIAEAVKVNPKVQEIMDNFEELKKQLMASVELTEDCSW